MTVKNWKSFEEVVDGIKKVLSKFQSIFVFDPIPSHMRDYKPFSDTLQSDGSNIAGGSLEKFFSEGLIEKALKMADSLVDEPKSSEKKRKRKPPVELKGKATERGNIMSIAPLSEWGIEAS